MFNKMIVHEALKKSLATDLKIGIGPENQTDGQDGIISLLIHDVFGGEILKTHQEKNWHFYNRIDGERVDFTGQEAEKPIEIAKFEDVPSTPDETYDYFDLVDYSTFFTRFIRAFEETIGLDNCHPGYSV
jgi:hypothetical protein